MFDFFRRRTPLEGYEQSRMSPFDEYALHLILKKFYRTDLRILEIGSWLGSGSTKIFSYYADLIVCVDTWKGNVNTQHKRIVEFVNPYDIFLKNTESFADKVIAIHADSKNIWMLREESFDLVFIDGDHRYQQTEQDIRNSLSLVKSGGILCGHDCEGRLSQSNRQIIQNNLSIDHCPSIFENFVKTL